MKAFFFNKHELDKKYLIACLVTICCGIMCGIVLVLVCTVPYEIKKYAEYYIKYVLKFKNENLLFPYFLHCFIFCLVFLGFAYLKKLKYLSLAVLFLRAFVFGYYFILLLMVGEVGGAVVALFVFMPSSLISFALTISITEIKDCVNKKYCLFLPLVFAIVALILYSILLNVVFRFFIMIV